LIFTHHIDYSFLLTVTPPALERLDKDSRRSMRAAFRPGTEANLRTQLRSYLLFCNYFKLTPFPASPYVLRCFIQLLSRTFKSHQSIRNYVSGIKTFHSLLGHKTCAFTSIDVLLTMRGIAKLSTHHPRQKLPVTPDMLLNMHKHLDLDDSLDTTVYAAILIMFFAFLRRSNITPRSTTSFDVHRNLTRRDIVANPAGLGVIIRWSKTIQCHERVLTIPLTAIPSSPLCPIAAYSKMVQLIPAAPQDPAFVVPHRDSKLRPLTQAQLATRFKELISSIGLDHKLYSLHSLRRGGATFARLAGVPTDLIKIHGDWKSNAYQLYIKVPFTQRLSLTQDMARLIRNKLGSTTVHNTLDR